MLEKKTQNQKKLVKKKVCEQGHYTDWRKAKIRKSFKKDTLKDSANIPIKRKRLFWEKAKNQRYLEPWEIQ